MNPNMGPGAAGPSGRPGQMTAVMRAVAQQAGPKVLRIGLVQSGRVIEERVIKQEEQIQIWRDKAAAMDRALAEAEAHFEERAA